MKADKRQRTKAALAKYIKMCITIYILHCFQKKTQKTRSEDIALAARRYKELVLELNR